jgi:hypothetical protein
MCNFFRQTYNNSDLTITNCIFSGNSANDVGGGMYIYAISRMMITNCTFSGNMAGRGGGFYSNFESRTTVKNCILWGNEGKQISLTASVTYSDIEGGWAGTGNIDVDPCFVKPGYWGDVNDPNIPREPNEPNAIWIDGNYRLQSDSPCIDAGNNNSVPPDYVDLDRDGNTTEPTPLDIDDFPRFIDGDCNGTAIVDMGTYEFLHGDINHNGSVNFIDFAILASQWFQSNCGECCGADLTCDGQVNWADLREFAEHWLAGTAP